MKEIHNQKAYVKGRFCSAARLKRKSTVIGCNVIFLPLLVSEMQMNNGPK